MGLGDLTNWGPTEALEASVRFAGARQRLIAHNIANISTPDFVQLDIDPTKFQARLARAIDARREVGGAGPLKIESGDEIDVHDDGTMSFNPTTPVGGVAAHDRNNRDLERLMQDQAENLLVYRQALDLLRSRADMMRSALGQRV